eukprot:7912804-Alexandrium_andersonii.AAC.1
MAARWARSPLCLLWGGRPAPVRRRAWSDSALRNERHCWCACCHRGGQDGGPSTARLVTVGAIAGGGLARATATCYNIWLLNALALATLRGVPFHRKRRDRQRVAGGGLALAIAACG